MKTFKEFLEENTQKELTIRDINALIKKMNTQAKKLGLEVELGDLEKSPSKVITGYEIWVNELDDDDSEPVGRFITDGQTFQWRDTYGGVKSGTAGQGIKGAVDILKKVSANLKD